MVLVLIGIVAGGLFGRLPARTSAENGTTSEQVLADYKEAVKLINESYSGPIDLEKETDSAMQSMLWTLDPHSSFFSRDELRKLDEEQSSQFYGIGVSILQHRGGVFVQSVIPNTPADKAGIRYGDRFYSVEGKDAKDWTSSEVSKNVRGERGTTVKVQIDRVGSTTPIDFEITRGGVPLPSIRNSFMLPNSVGYVGLTGGFQLTTSEELSLAIADLKKKGMKSLILDLRGNPGGILEQAVGVVSKFIPTGETVVSVGKGFKSEKERVLQATGGNPETFPLVVMINGGSASASEIVAGAIQDYDRGVIVGSDSFGKGLVQRVFRLPYGTGITLTTARYYTPFGRSLQRDYSTGSIYDYYTHGEDIPADETDAKPKPVGSPVTTANGRVLLGGRGIEPDVKAETPTVSPLRGRINEAAFFFVRQLIAGKIAGFENYKIEKQNFKLLVMPTDFVITDKLFEAFRNFSAGDNANGLTAQNISSQLDYAKTRLREEIATANYSNEAGIQVLLENDPQVLKAIEVMPQAGTLVASAPLGGIMN